MLIVKEAIEVMKRNSLIIEKEMILNKSNKEKPLSMKSSAPSNFSSNLYFKWCRVLNQHNLNNNNCLFRGKIHQKLLYASQRGSIYSPKPPNNFSKLLQFKIPPLSHPIGNFKFKFRKLLQNQTQLCYLQTRLCLSLNPYRRLIQPVLPS